MVRVQKKQSFCACDRLGRLPHRGGVRPGTEKTWIVDFVLAGRRPNSQEKQDREKTREISEVATCKAYSYAVGWLKVRFHVGELVMETECLSLRQFKETGVHQIALIIFSQPIKRIVKLLLYTRHYWEWGKAEK